MQRVVMLACCVMFLQSGLSEPDKDENKPTSDSDDGYSKDLVISCFTGVSSCLCMMHIGSGHCKKSASPALTFNACGIHAGPVR